VQERARNLEAQVEQLLALPAHEEEELARAGYGNRRLTEPPPPMVGVRGALRGPASA
jgi:hypothetical protein